MKIAVSGTQCIGKSTFIADFIKKWPMYKIAGQDCSSIIKKQKLQHSQDSNEQTQDILLNHLVDLATEHSKEEYVIYDRCVLDNLAYTIWLHLKGKIDEKYVQKIVPIIQQSLKLYDIIFFAPITKMSPINIEQKGNTRDIDPIFREEIDNIFNSFASSYYKGDKKLFPTEDCPALIEIFGKLEERIKVAELYINENGNMFSEDESLLSIPPEFNPDLREII